MCTELTLTKSQIQDARTHPHLQQCAERWECVRGCYPTEPVSQGGLPGGGDILGIL